MVSAEITDTAICGWLPDRPLLTTDGAEVVFRGMVRDEEDGQSIAALVYEQYEGMARNELQRLGETASGRFAISSLDCIHRVGTIPVGEAAIVVVIRSRHRAEGFAAMGWFMDELKRVVPIWKTGSVPC
ncbi:MAG: molybdenum cofactor biosynthesis protein MoaE [Prosthecochloris sp.]|nr:molybdenum cofactor biosynthesis protein MoaE [Prosthecochloris sp.]